MVRARRPSARWLALLALALPVCDVAPAGAATAVTTNACGLSFEGFYRDLDVGLTLEGPGEVQPGAPVVLGGRIETSLPSWLGTSGYNARILEEGVNELPVQVWLAVEGVGTTEGVQVLELATTASTTVTVKGEVPSATPIDVAIALPPTTWTPAGGGDLSFRQAGSGALGTLPGVGPDDTALDVMGSMFLAARAGDAILGFDCLPGRSTQQGSSYAAGEAAPAHTVAVASAPATSGAPATAATTVPAGTTAPPATGAPPTTSAPATTSAGSSGEATTSTPSTATTTTPPPSTSAATATSTSVDAGGEALPSPGDDEDEGGGAGGATVLAVVAGLLVIGAAGFAWWRKRTRATGAS